jgi:transcriptional regulator with XRE-family HTH domain
MLKERINYLCKKQNISRKELVAGLITVPHLSNILSGRYSLAADLADEFGKRLGVTGNYLLKVNDISDSQLKDIDCCLELMILDRDIKNVSKGQMDSLVMELSSALIEACYYQKRGDSENYQHLVDNYLRFYLTELSEQVIIKLPLPLQKAYFYFYLQYYSSTNQYDQTLNYLDKLMTLIDNHLGILVKVTSIQIDLLVKIRHYDKANQVLEELFHKVQSAGKLEYLTLLYILKSGVFFNLRLFQEALVNLSKAEENLSYIKEENNYFSMIMNNRIVMLLHLKKFSEVTAELQRFEVAYKNAGQQDNPEVKVFLTLYHCELALQMKDWKLLKEYLGLLKEFKLSEEQDMAVSFDQAHVLWYLEKDDTAENLLQNMLPFFERENRIDQLVSIYELLAEITEQKKKYKQANEYRKKIIELLKMK